MIVNGLVAALSHTHQWVRRNAADALGTAVPIMLMLPAAIVDVVLAALADAVEAEGEQEMVRLSAVLSLARLAGSVRADGGTRLLGERGMEAASGAMRCVTRNSKLHVAHHKTPRLMCWFGGGCAGSRSRIA